VPAHDYSLANQSGAAFRSDLNDALNAIVTLNSGTSAPSTTFARMLWADNTTGLLKIRNASNTDWVTVGTMASANLGLLPLIRRKTADESVTSSTTFQDDDHLVFPIGANEEWVATYDLIFGNAPGDSGVKVTMVTPSGATQRFTASLIISAGGDANCATTTGSGVILNFTQAACGASSDVSVKMSIWVLNGATPGNVQLQWAQNTSSATPLASKKGGHLVAHRIA